MYLTGTVFEMSIQSLSKFVVSLVNKSSNCPRSELREFKILSINRNSVVKLAVFPSLRNDDTLSFGSLLVSVRRR